MIFCIFVLNKKQQHKLNQTKGQTFWRIPGFYLTSGVVDYMAVIFSTHLVAMKCKFFFLLATQQTRSPLLPANRICQSIVHAQRFK